jgi:hypothetical protein
MKLLLTYVLTVAWAASWFCGCGGAASLNANQTQNNNQQQNGSSSSEDADPCILCVGTFAEIAECLDGFGMLPEDCES